MGEFVYLVMMSFPNLMHQGMLYLVSSNDLLNYDNG